MAKVNSNTNTNTSNNSTDNFSVPITAADATAFVKVSGNKTSSEREQLIKNYGKLNASAPYVKYRVEKSKDGKDKTAEKTKESITPFLTRSGKVAKVYLDKVAKDYIWIKWEGKDKPKAE